MALVVIPRRQVALGSPLHLTAPTGDQAPGAETPHAAAAAAPASQPDANTKWLAVLALVAGGAAAAVLMSLELTTISLNPDVSVFAVFYIFAQALERAFEFLKLFWPGLGKATIGQTTVTKNQATEKRDRALADAINEGSESSASHAATAQAALEQVQANRNLLAWAINSAIAMAGAGLLGLRLIATITAPAWPYATIDVILTGLVIGGGTKPLHDLIETIQASKKKAEEPPATRKP